jgi:uncharacterized protein YrrD
MLRSLNDMEKYSIRATDGDIGQVKDFYFDDVAWVIRYLVVETGSWLASKKVLISPISIHAPDWVQHVLPVRITKDQVKKSPDIDTDKPVSLQYQHQYHDYYGYPYYWGGDGIWGGGLYPTALMPGYVHGDDAVARRAAEEAYAKAERLRHRNDDPHLRSCKAVVGYHIHASDGEIGHVESLIVDQDTWAIRYFVINTSNWWVGHKVLIAPQWISGVHWQNQTVAVDMTREAVRSSPAFLSTAEMNRSQEVGLYTHYGRTRYWAESPALKSERPKPDPLTAQAGGSS